MFQAYNTDPKRAVAVIGLGTGTMACYAMPGQTFDFYDIDPVVVGISFDTNEFFTFVEDAEERGANISLVLGDARLTFDPKGARARPRLKPLHKRQGEKVPARQHGLDLTSEQKYGLIVVDAFSSDAIPIHLITREALEIYRDRLLPDGVLCMHISNRHLDLQPVLANIVEELGMAGIHLSDKEDKYTPGKSSSHWVAIARKREHMEKVLHLPRWTVEKDQLAALGTALWPSQAGTVMGCTTGLAYAIHRTAEITAREQEKTAGKPPSEWKPLDTTAELQRRLEETSDNATSERLTEKLLLNRKVGVWSDDYSNLLSVFNW
jgi:hypothetical protein